MKHFFFFFLLSLISSTILIGEPYSEREIKDTLKQAIMLNSKLDQLFIAKYGELHPFKPYIEKTKRILAAYIQESIKQADRDPTALSQLEMVVSAVSDHTQNIMQSFSENSNQSNTPQAVPLPQQPMQDYLHAMHNVQGAVPQSYQNFIAGQKEKDTEDLKNALTVFGVTFGILKLFVLAIIPVSR